MDKGGHAVPFLVIDPAVGQIGVAVVQEAPHLAVKLLGTQLALIDFGFVDVRFVDGGTLAWRERRQINGLR